MTLFTIVGAIVCYAFGVCLVAAILGTFIVGLITLFDKNTK